MSLDISLYDDDDEMVFTCNMSHNLTALAKEVDLYKLLWRTEELNINTPSDAVPLLKDGLVLLNSTPNNFKDFAQGNMWGDYNSFVTNVELLLNACEDYPNSSIGISR